MHRRQAPTQTSAAFAKTIGIDEVPAIKGGFQMRGLAILLLALGFCVAIDAVTAIAQHHAVKQKAQRPKTGAARPASNFPAQTEIRGRPYAGSLHFGLVGFRTRLPKKGLVSPGLKNGFSKHEAEFGHAELCGLIAFATFWTCWLPYPSP